MCIRFSLLPGVKRCARQTTLALLIPKHTLKRKTSIGIQPSMNDCLPSSPEVYEEIDKIGFFLLKTTNCYKLRIPVLNTAMEIAFFIHLQQCA